MFILEFGNVADMSGISEKTYCIFTSFNLESVDAVILLDVFIQVFTIKKGKTHGFKIKGQRKIYNIFGSEAVQILIMCSCQKILSHSLRKLYEQRRRCIHMK
jgi:predicted transporter